MGALTSPELHPWQTGERSAVPLRSQLAPVGAGCSFAPPNQQPAVCFPVRDYGGHKSQLPAAQRPRD